MKKSLFFLFLASFLALFLYNCSKTQDDALNTGINNQNASSREGTIDPFSSSKVRLSQGMLEFDDYLTYKGIYENLRLLSANSEFSQSAYVELGYDLSQEANVQLTDQPVLEKFEKRFNLISSRKVEENQFFDYLNSGGEPKAFQGSFIYDLVLKALLNQNNEVKIGSRIFKFLDERKVAIVLNSDFSALETVRNTPISEQKDFYNVLIYDKNDVDDNEIELFERDGQGNPREFSNLCIVSANISGVNGLTYTFINTSNVENGCGFKWSFGDGTPDYYGTVPPSHTYPAGMSSAIASVQATQSPGQKCSCKDQTFTLTINLQGPPPCDSKFSVAISNGNVVDLVALSNTANTTYSWNFGNGSTGSGKSVQYVYSASGVNTYTITLTETRPDGICSGTKQITLGCGAKNGKEEDDEDMTVSNRKWRLEGVIWSQNNVLQNTMGSSSKSYRRFGGIWYQKKADKLWVSLEGDYFEQVTTIVGGTSITQCGNQNIPFLQETESNSNYVARNIGGTKNASFLDNYLKSTHKIKVGTTEWETEPIFLID